ncbi:ferritin-like domain-containing protein [Streptomyces sp. NPDC012637]|uniref:ferritin-like domain-containing protein n=1 Tax=Streptomyces sp. NPDC012637 TaxID=3364842 RepID=UPI0036E74DDD
MSVFDTPRVYFAGTAVTGLPTGPRAAAAAGLLDLATNTVLGGGTAAEPLRGEASPGEPFPTDRPAADCHAMLGERGASGGHLSGNGHFSVDARVTSADGPDGAPAPAGDPLLGRAVDLWGHYNPYLGTTANRARVFDVDPASAWTTTLMIGRFALGREGRSHDSGHVCLGDVTGFQPPRWQSFDPAPSVLHQFAVPSGPALDWPDVPGTPSPLAGALRAAAEEHGGLLVQFGLEAAGPPGSPGHGYAGPGDTPQRWRLHGVIAPWRPQEPRTHPAGRLLVPYGADRTGHGGRRARVCSVRVTSDEAVFNLPFGRPGPGDLELRTVVSDELVAVLREADGPHGSDGSPGDGGLVARVPVTAPGAAWAADEGLCLVEAAGPPGDGRPGDQEPAGCEATGRRGAVLLRERESVVVTDDAALFVEHPDRERGEDHAVEVAVRAAVRGRPAALEPVVVRQFANPRALPRDPVAAAPEARTGDLRVVELRPGRLTDGKEETADGAPDGPVADGPVPEGHAADGAVPEKHVVDGRLPEGHAADGPADFGDSCRLVTDVHGRGWFTVRGARAGTARLLLAVDGDEPPLCPADSAGSAAAAYDDADALGWWAGAGGAHVRVLPDDWHLDAVPKEDVGFDLLHREVFAFYEQLFPFMRDEVFSLADRCKVETYAKLIWQMCDPANKDRTYYMPPTRDLTLPKARLLLTYLRARGAADAVLPVTAPAPAAAAARPRITTRAQLREALWQAVTVELATSLQYLYAGYSLPTHGAGFAYVGSGVWTPRQLRLACGDGGETLSRGIRDTLFAVAREEMIHFLVVNNILMAMGEPFHVPAIDFGTPGRLPLPLDFALEPLHLGSVQRFIAIERPERLAGDRSGGRGGSNRGAASGVGDTAGGREDAGGPAPFGSPSELYAAIRDGLTRVPDLFLVERGRGGGEHHLFLGRAVDARHPDYQLEVDDLSSALFAVDFVTEQGEGGVLDAPGPPPESHHDTFVRLGELLMTERADGPGGQGAPWSPAYPALRNPTLDPAHPGRAVVRAPHARAVMRLFNRCYFLMLQLMVQHFAEGPDASLRRSRLMNAAIDVMTGTMRPLAELLVTLDSGWRGRTAGPSFELEEPPVALARPDVARRAFAMRFAHLARMARECEGVPGRVPELMAFYAEQFGGEGAHTALSRADVRGEGGR